MKHGNGTKDRDDKSSGIEILRILVFYSSHEEREKIQCRKEARHFVVQYLSSQCVMGVFSIVEVVVFSLPS